MSKLFNENNWLQILFCLCMEAGMILLAALRGQNHTSCIHIIHSRRHTAITVAVSNMQRQSSNTVKLAYELV